MSLRKGLLGILSACLLWIASAAAQQGTVKIGVINSTSGDFAALGRQTAEAIRMGVTDLAAAGGVAGRQIELVEVDDAGSAEGAVAAFRDLVTQSKVEIVIGPLTTRGTKATAPLAAASGIYQIVPSAHGEELIDTGSHTLKLFPNVKQYKTMASTMILRQFQPKRVALLSSSSPFGSTARVVMGNAFGQGGASVVADEVFTEWPEEINVDAQLARIAAAKPDLLVFPSYYDRQSQILATAARKYLPNVTLVGEGTASPALRAMLAKVADTKLFFVDFPFGPQVKEDAVMQRFVGRFEKALGRLPTPYDASAYSSVLVAKTILERTNSKKMPFEKFSPLTVSTASGPLRFDASGNVSPRLAIYRLNAAGQFVSGQ